MTPTADAIVVIVGNPQAASRTLSAAQLVGSRLAPVVSASRPPAVEVIDLAEYAEPLVRWGDPAIEPLRATVLSARALVVASPTYKATFTGLLKLFLERFARDELAGVPTVAVMTGASADHALAADVHLIPVLVEIGASVPTRGVFLAGAAVDDPEPVVDAWFATAEAALRRALR